MMLIFLYIILIIVSIALILAILLLVFLFITKVPFVRTPKVAIPEIMRQIPKRDNIKVIDIGCGDGTILYELEKIHPSADISGYEITPSAYFQAKIKRWLNKSKYKLYYQNFYKVDLSGADVVFCFLIESVMPKVEKKLLAELEPGALVISYGFRFPNWQPERSINNPSPNLKSKIIVYKKH